MLLVGCQSNLRERDDGDKVFPAGCKDKLMRSTGPDDGRLAGSNRDGRSHVTQRRRKGKVNGMTDREKGDGWMIDEVMRHRPRDNTAIGVREVRRGDG
jgi:hypothetical protein